MNKEYIRTSGLRGFRKTKVRVLVENEQGHERELLVGELQRVKQDKRHRKRRDYVTLLSLSKYPRIDLTLNIATHRLSVNFWLGFHHGYAVVEEEDVAKLMGVFSYLYPRYRGTLMTITRNISFYHKIIAEWYYHQTRKKVIAARSAWFRSAKARRSRQR